jgi:coproporphyrinogen III oxidase-like Fe-S oxidoreductase
LPLPDPDLAAEMYEWLSEVLEENGYVQYEISNWAKIKPEGGRQKDDPDSSFILYPSALQHPSSFQCLHNLQYWRGLPYLAFGGGAWVRKWLPLLKCIAHKTYIERSQITNSQLHPLSPATINHHKQTSRTTCPSL